MTPACGVTRMCCGACRQAFRPRLLVLVALAACVYAYNGIAEQPVGAGVQLALFAGFLSYKVAPLGHARHAGLATAYAARVHLCSMSPEVTVCADTFNVKCTTL